MPRTRIRSMAMSLPVVLLKEGRTFIAYTPALDLSASGSTAERAKKNFETTLRLFTEELVEAGTTDAVLREMGWVKQERQWQPPVEVRQVSEMSFRVPVTA